MATYKTERLLMEDVRCFHGASATRLAPLTILMGENSTGKSTFLAMLQRAWALVQRPGGDVGDDLLGLSSYNQIAALRAGRAGGRVKAFRVGMAIKSPRSEAEIEVVGTFGAEGARPILQEWVASSSGYRIRVRPGEPMDEGWTIKVEAGSGEFTATQKGQAFPLIPPAILAHFVLSSGASIGFTVSDSLSKEDSTRAGEIVGALQTASSVLYASAPIRSRPRRTYDPAKEDEQPEGSHVPMVLAKAIGSRNDKESDGLLAVLREFGDESGLFEQVTVRRKGGKEGDPFQVFVKIKGSSAFNIADVGYGVGQVLPIVVDATRSGADVFLLQQPEVHLHPRAQAELGSLFGAFATTRGKQFLIETHSDYLLDRIRMDVRDGRVAAEDVLILFFERRGPVVHIHEIRLDEAANLIGAPPEYRAFFLGEERRLLGG
jgi:hypothetical protein